MKKILFVIGLLSFVITAAAVAVPQYINYQGVLRDSAGDLVTGQKAMTFKLYSAATGGTALWTMTSNEVTVNNGLYNIQLGPLGHSTLASGSRWLEVIVGTETLSPRLEILAVAYAITAASAESVGGYSVSATGNNVIPVTNSIGQLDSSVIPDASINVSHAASADYSALSGTATSAADAAHATDAEMVGGIEATTEAAANKLLALDGDIKLKGMAVSAEASSGYAMFIDGKLGASGCVGNDTISFTNSSKTITDATKLNASSIVLVSGGVHGTHDPGATWVYRTSDDSFTFKITNAAPVGGYPFNYIIIN